jgi:hypothetical protein
MAVGIYTLSCRLEIDIINNTNNLVVLANSFPSTPTLYISGSSVYILFPYGVALTPQSCVISMDFPFVLVDSSGGGSYTNGGILVPTPFINGSGSAISFQAYRPDFTDELSQYNFKTFPLTYFNLRQYYNA